MNANESISVFGAIQEQTVHVIKLTNSHGTEIQVLTYGATWHAFTFSDNKNRMHDVIVSPKSMEGYLAQFDVIPYYFGATIGRYAGRIAKGQFQLNDQSYQLYEEDGVHLHGGPKGIHSKIWQITSIHEGRNPSVSLSCQCRHLEDGYPGNLKVNATYRLTENNEVKITYEAVSDWDTVLNLTNHAYFNLGEDSVLDHQLQIHSDTILEVDDKLLPSGKLLPISKSPFDFQELRELSPIKAIDGLDHCFAIAPDTRHDQIRLKSPKSGLCLEVATNQPAVVVYAPQQLRFAKTPKNEKWPRLEFPSICLETQHFPDAPNHAHFPSAVLKSGVRYNNTTHYKFSKANQ